MCHMNDCLEQIEKSFIKTGWERKENDKKGLGKRLNFVFLSSCLTKRPNHMPPSWNFNRPFISILPLLRSSTQLNVILRWFFLSVSCVSFWIALLFVLSRKQKGWNNHLSLNRNRKSCGSTSRREKTQKHDKENKKEASDNGQLFTYNLHLKLQLYCLAVSNLCCSLHTQAARSDVVVQCLDMINDSL